MVDSFVDCVGESWLCDEEAESFVEYAGRRGDGFRFTSSVVGSFTVVPFLECGVSVLADDGVDVDVCLSVLMFSTVFDC